jgi:hypothetical protein
LCGVSGASSHGAPSFLVAVVVVVVVVALYQMAHIFVWSW